MIAVYNPLLTLVLWEFSHIEWSQGGLWCEWAALAPARRAAVGRDFVVLVVVGALEQAGPTGDGVTANSRRQ